MKVGDPGGSVSPAVEKQRKKALFSPTIKRRRPSYKDDGQEGRSTTKNFSAYRTITRIQCHRGHEFVRGILALMSSASVNSCMEFVNRAFNAAIHIRRCAVLRTTADDMR
jgi:hypothetical protein